MPTTYGNDIVYCLKSHCGVRGYCRQKWVLQVQIICKFSNERTCKRNKDVQGLSCGFEVIEINYTPIDNGICFSVVDTGIGISPENQTKIFKRFEKLNDFVQGTGLGLAISSSLAAAMRGKVGVESIEGKGSTFWLWVPKE